MIALSVAKLKMFSSQSEIFLWIKPKKKVESLDQCERLEVCEKARNVFLRWAWVCLTTRSYTTSHLHQVFLDFARILCLFSLVFRTSNFWSLRNLINHSIRACWIWDRLQPTRRYAPRWLFTISYPTRAHGIIVNYSSQGIYSSW